MTNPEHVSNNDSISGKYSEITFVNSTKLEDRLASSHQYLTLYSAQSNEFLYPINHMDLNYLKQDDSSYITLQSTLDFDASVVNRYNYFVPWQEHIAKQLTGLLEQRGIKIYQLKHQRDDFYLQLNETYAAHVEFCTDTHTGIVTTSIIPFSELNEALNGGVELFESVSDDHEEPSHLSTLRQFCEIWSLVIDMTISEFGEPQLNDTAKPKIVIAPPVDHQLALTTSSIEIPSRENIDTTEGFNTIGGLVHAKARLEQYAAAFTNPLLAKKYDIAPKHFLLYGPPGTGKTSLAYAFANESGAIIQEVSSADIVDKWVGSSARNLQKIMKQAMKKSTSQRVELFLDEFDLIAGKQNLGSSERNDLKKHLGKYLDEISSSHPNLLVVCATNADIDDIEPSLVRSGRIEPIGAPLPNETERIDVWAAVLTRSMMQFDTLNDYHSAEPTVFVPYENDINPIELAKYTDGMSGADFTTILERARFKLFLQARHTPEVLGKVSQADLLHEIKHFAQ